MNYDQTLVCVNCAMLHKLDFSKLRNVKEDADKLVETFCRFNKRV